MKPITISGLDRWFKRHYPGFPHAMLEKSLRKGEIRVNGAKVKSSERVQSWQTIEIRCKLPDGDAPKAPASARTLSPDDINLMRDAGLYKDDNLIIINKAGGAGGARR